MAQPINEPEAEPCERCCGSGMVAVGPWGSRPPRETCPECHGSKLVPATNQVSP